MEPAPDRSKPLEGHDQGLSADLGRSFVPGKNEWLLSRTSYRRTNSNPERLGHVAKLFVVAKSELDSDADFEMRYARSLNSQLFNIGGSKKSLVLIINNLQKLQYAPAKPGAGCGTDRNATVDAASKIVEWCVYFRATAKGKRIRVNLKDCSVQRLQDNQPAIIKEVIKWCMKSRRIETKYQEYVRTLRAYGGHMLLGLAKKAAAQAQKRIDTGDVTQGDQNLVLESKQLFAAVESRRSERAIGQLQKQAAAAVKQETRKRKHEQIKVIAEKQVGAKTNAMSSTGAWSDIDPDTKTKMKHEKAKVTRIYFIRSGATGSTM
jgi:hypothetical protein